jgi:DAACS family dicarboxylate/amino acid:cation (Na+ or H+) symporter/aerobic C4-dicarboxylate transport protein
MDFVMNIIPDTIVDAFAKGNVLQILLFSILLGVALAHVGPREKVFGPSTRTARRFYYTIAAIFIAQATNTPLTLMDQLIVLAVLMFTSKGSAGVTGSGFIILAATLSSLGTIPVAGMVLLLGVDRFMSEARAITNTIGNGVGTMAIAKWVGALDTVKMNKALNGEGAEEKPEMVQADVIAVPSSMTAGRLSN